MDVADVATSAAPPESDRACVAAQRQIVHFDHRGRYGIEVQRRDESFDDDSQMHPAILWKIRCGVILRTWKELPGVHLQERGRVLDGGVGVMRAKEDDLVCIRRRDVKCETEESTLRIRRDISLQRTVPESDPSGVREPIGYAQARTTEVGHETGAVVFGAPKAALLPDPSCRQKRDSAVLRRQACWLSALGGLSGARSLTTNGQEANQARLQRTRQSSH